MKGRESFKGSCVRAVIFDLDDTLILSTIDFGKFKGEVIDKIEAWGEKRSNYPPSETIVVILSRFESACRERGLSEQVIRQRLSELDRIMDRVELEWVEETKAIEGAFDLLTKLRAMGIKVGVLTRSCDEYARTALSVTGMRDLVDEIECRNSDTKAKPDPESYLKLSKALGLRPEETLFVGDHPIDAQCARNAGVLFVAVMTGDVPERALRDAGSLEVFENVGKMVDWVERVVNG